MGFFAGRPTRIGNSRRSAYLYHLPSSYPLSMFLRRRRSYARSQLVVRGECSKRYTARVIGAMASLVALAGGLGWAQQAEPAGQLVRETVYNELQDHNRHGYWRYWIEQRVQNDTRLQEQVETADGPIARLLRTNGHPVDAQTREEEQSRLQHLVNSPQEQASHRKDYIDDEKHVVLIMGLLPDAYEFEFLGDENGLHHLRFRPSPAFVPRTVEARVIHAMAGDLWIDARMKRLARLEGHLNDNVDFGFGLLGRLDKGGWFRVSRVQVSPTEWKTRQLELHLSGRAVLFKTIARDTDETRGGFAAVPPGISLAQGMRLLDQPDPRSAPDTMARISPVSLVTHR